jgi:hypothetical protein
MPHQRLLGFEYNIDRDIAQTVRQASYGCPPLIFTIDQMMG